MFSETFISNDKVPEELRSCERRRPDFVFRTKGSPLTVILEVDENQHDKSSSYTCSKNCTCPHRTCKCKSPTTCINKDYTCGCETRRMRVITQFVHPVLWIRYNPDEYTIKGKTKGTIQPSNDKRKVILLEWLSHVLNNSEKYCESVMKSGGAEVMYLFYDDFQKDAGITTSPLKFE